MTPQPGRAREGAAPSWTVDAAAGPDAWNLLAPEWGELWHRARPRLPLFLHPDWVRAHVDAFEKPSNLRLFSARQRGRLAGVLPLIREQGWFRGLPVRRLRAAAGVHSLRFDLIASKDEDGRQAASALAHALHRQRDWDVIELRDVPGSGPAEWLMAEAGAMGHAVGRWESMQSPYVDLTPPTTVDGPPAGMQGTKGSFRIELRRTRRRLEAWARERGGQGELRLVRAPTTADRLGAELAAFYRLEAAGWKGQAQSAIACRPPVQSFYTQAAQAMAQLGTLVLHRLELDGRAIAMSYGLCDGERYDVLKWAYDETLAQFGPGHLLIESIIGECVQATGTVRRFWINGPDAPYKRKWTRTAETLSFLYIFREGGYGNLLRRLKFDWTPRLKRAVAGLRRGGEP